MKISKKTINSYESTYKDGYDKEHWNKDSINEYTGTQYDKEGYNKDGYDILNWDKNSIHKETGSKYDKYGYARRFDTSFKLTIGEKEVAVQVKKMLLKMLH